VRAFRRNDAEPEIPADWPDWHRRRRMAEEYFVPWVQAALPLEGRTVLEYGCGYGSVTAAFAPHAGRYIGIDIDETAIAYAGDVLPRRGVRVELVAAPPEKVLDAAAAYRGEVDVFLCYAVLEHMTVGERLALLRLARESVRPGGIIVIIETPNRLMPVDYHTSQLPFLGQLPEELALAYLDRSPRAEFVEGMREAAAKGAEAELEAYVRWGRGMSYHELELVFEDLAGHVVASSYEPALLGERRVYRDELALQRVLDTERPDLPGAFSRYWLDVILTPSPGARRRFLHPWPLVTTASKGAFYDEARMVQLEQDAVLAVVLPQGSSRLVVGLEAALPGTRVNVKEYDSGAERTVEAVPGGPSVSYDDPGVSHADFVFDALSVHYEIRLDRPGVVSYVLFER